MAYPTRPSATGAAGTTTKSSTTPKTTTQTTSSQTSGSQSSSSSSTSSRTSNTQNMTASALGALDTLIKGLMSGSKEGALAGLDQSRQQWNAAVTNAAQLQSDYSKSAAFADSDAAVSATLAEGIEQAMPAITAGIDAAGTSGSAMSALLTQKAATDSAREAAKLGLSSAIQYGQINVEAGRTLAGLVESGDPTVTALLSVLGIAKGAVQNTQESASSSSTESQSSQSSTTGQAFTVEAGGDQTIVETPNAKKSGSKAKSWQAPASSTVTSNTGGGWMTSYAK